MRQHTPAPVSHRWMLLTALLPFLTACTGGRLSYPLLRGTVTELWTIVFVLIGGVVICAVVLITLNVLYFSDASAPAPRRRK